MNFDDKVNAFLKQTPEALWFKVLVLALVFVIPSAIYLLSFGVGGFDSYYFLGKICGQNNYDYTPLPELAFWVVNWFPCNELLVKITSIGVLASSIFILFGIFEMVAPKKGFLGILAVAITNIFISFHFRFENDLFAYPLIFLSLYFFLRYLQENKNLFDLLTSMALLFFSSFFWKGGVFYLLGFGLAEPLIFLPALVMAFIHFPELINNLVPRFEIAENNPIRGLWNFILYGVVFLIGFKNNKEALKWYFPFLTIFFILLGILNPKLFFLALPFTALTILKIYEVTTQESKNIMVLAMIGLALVWPTSMLTTGYQPYEWQHHAAIDTVEYAQAFDVNIQNDWTYGHLIHYYGGQTKEHSGPGEYEFVLHDRVILTEEKLPCQIVTEYLPGPTITDPVTLYYCK